MIARSFSIAILATLYCVCATAETNTVSILSLLKPKNLTVTLIEPEKAILRADGSERSLSRGKPVAIRLNNGKLIENGIASDRMSWTCPEECVLQLEAPPDMNRRYKGALDLNIVNNTINIVLNQDREELVGSIMASEIGELRQPEAIRAFAIVVRSYLASGARHPERGADFCDTTHCQVFQSFAPGPLIAKALSETTGLVLTYRKHPFVPFYSLSCGGKTSTYEEVWGKDSPEYPYAAVTCPCATLAQYKWTTEIGRDLLANIFGLKLPHLSKNDSQILMANDKQSQSFTAEEFRTRIGKAIGWKKLRSNRYTITETVRGFAFAGQGSGHGLGFCQAGAELLAAKGMKYSDILSLYFPNTEFRTLP